ncbi:hypothetical protein FACS1894170_09680 [Planctomycetales bacterium]|nr:hypothetical protein FACS1894170_09680 [Planctomycetales bacterium]
MNREINDIPSEPQSEDCGYSCNDWIISLKSATHTSGAAAKWFYTFANMSIDTLYMSSPASTTTSVAGSDRLNELTMTDFIKMMTAELTNQDPANPMSNTEMLAQISQIRSITSNDKLTAGIEALTLGQSLSTASSLIGKNVTGVNSLNETISGKVDKVAIEGGKAKLFVGSSIINVENVTAIT